MARDTHLTGHETDRHGSGDKIKAATQIPALAETSK